MMENKIRRAIGLLEAFLEGLDDDRVKNENDIQMKDFVPFIDAEMDQARSNLLQDITSLQHNQASDPFKSDYLNVLNGGSVTKDFKYKPINDPFMLQRAFQSVVDSRHQVDEEKMHFQENPNFIPPS